MNKLVFKINYNNTLKNKTIIGCCGWIIEKKVKTKM